MSILDDLEKGTLSRDAVRAVKYVYPQLHQELVFTAAETVQDMKEKGKFLPMDKVVRLGLVLDAPVDSILERSRISSIQASFVPPAPPQGDAQPPQPQGSMIDPSLQTPMEQMV